MKVADVMKPGYTVYYSAFGDNRCVMATKVEPTEFDAVVSGVGVWGRHTQVTFIRATDGTGYSCHNGIAILD